MHSFQMLARQCICADKTGAVRQGDLLHSCAVEGVVADGDGAAQVDGFDIGAVAETVCADFAHALRQHDTDEVRLLKIGQRPGRQRLLLKDKADGNTNRPRLEGKRRALRHRALVAIGDAAKIDGARRLILIPSGIFECGMIDPAHTIRQITEIQQRCTACEAAVAEVPDVFTTLYCD